MTHTACVEAIAHSIGQNNSFLVVLHQNPDADTASSALCVANALKRLKKKAVVYSSDKLPSNIMFLPGAKTILQGSVPKNAEFDAIIFSECSTLKRAGDIGNLDKKTKCLISIDHHNTVEKYAHINCIMPEASSTAEIVYELLKLMRVNITAEDATLLYCGIVTDTGRFLYRNTSARTHEIIADLIRKGAKHDKVNDKFYLQKELPALKLISRSIDDMELICGQKASVMRVSLKDFEKFSAKMEHTEELVNYGLLVPGVKIAALLKETPERVVVNLRSRGSFDVSKIARVFGGGGHKNAAGFRTSQKLKDIEIKLVSEIKKLLS